MARAECKGCIYRGWIADTFSTCDYMILTGKPRGCPPGKGCIRRVINARHHIHSKRGGEALARKKKAAHALERTNGQMKNDSTIIMTD